MAGGVECGVGSDVRRYRTRRELVQLARKLRKRMDARVWKTRMWVHSWQQRFDPVHRAARHSGSKLAPP